MAKKTVFYATTPDNTETVKRTSARAYTHALALNFLPTEERYDEGWHVAATEADVPAEAYQARVAPHARPTSDNPHEWIYWGPKPHPATPGGWGIVSFHGSAELALKAGRQWEGRIREARAVPVFTK